MIHTFFLLLPTSMPPTPTLLTLPIISSGTSSPIDPIRHSELFKFVKVRNSMPYKKPIGKQILTTIGGIFYRPENASINDVYNKMVEYSGAQKSVNQYLEFEKQFKKSKAYISSNDAANQLFAPNVVEELLSSKFKTFGDVSEFINQKAANLSKSFEKDFNKIYAQAWDNIFIQGLALHPDMGIVSFLTDIIKSLELIIRLKTVEPKEEWDNSYATNILKSFIVLPQELIPKGVLNDLPHSNKPRTANIENERKIQLRIDLAEKIQKLQQTKELIQEWIANRLQEAAMAPQQAPQITLSPKGEIQNRNLDGTSERRTDADNHEMSIRIPENDLITKNVIGDSTASPAVIQHPTTKIGRDSIKELGLFTDDKSLIDLVSSYIKLDIGYDYQFISQSIDKDVLKLTKELMATSPMVADKTFLVGRAVITQGSSNQDSKPAPKPSLNDKDLYVPCKIKTLGTGDLLRVEQKMICYKPGEIAHIHNTLAGEALSRTTRRLKRTEDTFTEEIEKITEEERDLQTTDRYEMETETQKTLDQSFKLDSGMNVSGSYGTTDFEASLGFSMNLATSSSNRTATKFAKEVVETSKRKVTERIKTTHSIKVIEEFEETNVHSITNSSGDPQVGIYRWIDKFYKARLVNYGKRAFIEFNAPEPAAYHIYCKSQVTDPNLFLEKPIHPTELRLDIHGVGPIKSHEDIIETNYAMVSAIYEAQGVKPLSPYETLTTTSFSIPDKGAQVFNALYMVMSKDVIVPTGYAAAGVYMNVDHGNHPQKTPARYDWEINNGNSNDDLIIDYGYGDMWVLQMGNHTKKHPNVGVSYHAINPTSVNSKGVKSGGIINTITFSAKSILPVLITLKVYAIRLEESYFQWQIDTYNAIMTAYNKKLSDYNASLKQLKDDLNLIQGNNPGINRQIEARELKRICLEQLLDVRKANNWFCFKFWGQYGSIRDEKFICNNKEQQYPEVQFCDTIDQGKDITFFEQALEWRNMNYIFYPYFWARKCSWKILYNLDDNDPLFTQFLQCGNARVVLPIRPGFEAAVMNYLETGLVWNGVGSPVIGDPLFVDISTEIAEALDYDLGLIPDSDPRVISMWEFKLPTNLVLLQKYDQPSEESGLPCNQAPTIE